MRWLVRGEKKRRIEWGRRREKEKEWEREKERNRASQIGKRREIQWKSEARQSKRQRKEDMASANQLSSDFRLEFHHQSIPQVYSAWLAGLSCSSLSSLLLWLCGGTADGTMRSRWRLKDDKSQSKSQDRQNVPPSISWFFCCLLRGWFCIRSRRLYGYRIKRDM